MNPLWPHAALWLAETCKPQGPRGKAKWKGAATRDYGFNNQQLIKHTLLEVLSGCLCMVVYRSLVHKQKATITSHWIISVHKEIPRAKVSLLKNWTQFSLCKKRESIWSVRVRTSMQQYKSTYNATVLPLVVYLAIIWYKRTLAKVLFRY